MSPSSPWPAATPAPKRRRVHSARQTITDQSQVEQAMENCQINSGNDIVSCFPTADTVIPQHQWASFVWNSRRPELTQTNKVDVFLFRADSQQQLLHFRELQNPFGEAGLVRAQVNDTWFGKDGLDFTNTNTSFPFYWVIIRSDKTLDGTEQPQPIFTAVQIAVLDSVASSSLAAASSSSAAAASLSSLSAHPPSGAPQSPTGNIQNATSEGSFPHWAIAVIVVLGFLAVAATCILAFLILRRVRRRQRRMSSARNSMGSASPMMPRDTTSASAHNPEMIQRYDSAGSPLLPPTTIGAAALGSGPGTATHDGESTISDSGGPFSGADAAIMADAFRKMLRKPDFAGRPVEEGESPEQPEGEVPAAPVGDVVLRGQLAEEGRDIRSVSSSRGVKVESTESAQDPPPPLPDPDEPHRT
ncbi:hypothetical protein GALMADRAFT_57682 [Galerina marginata CBS 339.88]|uniref:Uncharacterized protein n=1 Tax=Galerina marginata (strain CBS 339.88) TaxID=685588 RepID=A0A067TGS5_GALM3|nr:hypothetical protein GALMADRAFT_57682 [Galerina marginata CBS 339.88]